MQGVIGLAKTEPDQFCTLTRLDDFKPTTRKGEGGRAQVACALTVEGNLYCH